MRHFRTILLLACACLLGALPVRAALFTVTSAADNTDVGTLRWAISQANSTAGADDIRFAVSTTFSIASALPAITDPLTISGSGNTLQATGSFSLFTLSAGSDGSVLQNMILNNSSNSNGIGIEINSGNNRVQGCIIGTDWSESVTIGFSDGITIDGYGNLIGGDSSLGYGNIISSNGSSGVVVGDGEGNSICGNIIGLNPDQDMDLGNGIAGIAVFSCDENVIGLPISGWGNVISGNNNYGIYMSSDKSTIQNNLIGPNSQDTATFANGAGIYASSSSLCQIGGDSTALEGNIFSGNSYGIYMVGSTNMTVCGNNIGLNAAQDTNWGNTGEGIYCYDVNNSTFGAPTPGWGNVICGNNYGMRLFEFNSGQIQGNLIGLNASGTAFGNTNEGLLMYDCFGNLIGGDSATGAGNIISANTANGISIYDNCAGNSVCGNVIGLDSTQTTDRGNTGHGIDIAGAGANTVGLPITGWGNVIGCNDQYGIRLGSNGGNTVRNNLIGTNASGADLGNGQGVYIASNNNLVGGDSTAGEGNVISGNNESGTSSRGIYVTGGSGNRICGNNIGLTPDQSTVLTNYRGIQLSSDSNTIGEPTAGWGNVISGNHYGLDFFSADNNTIQNNLIGLNASGTALPNTFSGIDLNGSHNNLIGGRLNANHYERNTISGHPYDTINLDGSYGNSICGNYLNTSLDGLTVIGTATEDGAITLNYSGNNLIGGSNSDADNMYGNLINSHTYGVRLQNASSNGNTITGNFVNILADGSVAASTMASGIYLYNSASGNLIGEPGTGKGNLVSGTDIGIYIDGSASLYNGIYGNTLTACDLTAIDLNSGANSNYPAPVITTLNDSTVAGTCSGATDFIEVFMAEPGAGSGGSLAYLGSTTASGGVWSMTIPSFGGQWVCATASDSNNNTSEFSANMQNTGATPTASPTATITPTATPSPTASSTGTPTPTGTASPTLTETPVLSATPTITDTPTATASPTSTTSPTITRTPDDRIDFKGKKSIAYPNPGRDRMTFAINSTPGASVAIHVYNLAGELVAAIETDLPANLRVVWDCPDIAPGIYVVRIKKDDSTWEKLKIAIVK